MVDGETESGVAASAFATLRRDKSLCHRSPKDFGLRGISYIINCRRSPIASGAVEAGEGDGEIVLSDDLGGSGFGQRGLRTKDIELGAGASLGTGIGQSQRFLSLFQRFLLRILKFAGLNVIGVGGADFKFDFAAGVVEIESRFFSQRAGFLNFAPG